MLFVTPYFPPTAGSGVQRGAKFVKYLLRQGWDVDVVTIEPAAWPDRDPSAASEIAGARVETVGLARIPGVSHTILRAMPGLRRAVRAALARRPDVVLATTPDYHWAVVEREAMRAQVPFVLDYPDPWTVLPEDFRTFRQPTKLRSRVKWAIAPRLERRLLVRAAGATFATEPILREYVLERYVSAGRAHLVTNGYDEGDFVGLTESDHGGDRLVVAHVGSFGGMRTPIPAARAAGWIAAQGHDVELVLVGAGAEPFMPEVHRAAAGAEVRATGWVEHAEAVREMCAADVLWLDAMVHLRSAATGKVYEYLRAGRPIVALAHPLSPAAALVRDLEAGVVVSSEDPASCGAAILRAASSWSGPVPVERLEPFSREHQASQLSTVLRALM